MFVETQVYILRACHIRLNADKIGSELLGDRKDVSRRIVVRMLIDNYKDKATSNARTEGLPIIRQRVSFHSSVNQFEYETQEDSIYNYGACTLR